MLLSKRKGLLNAYVYVLGYPFVLFGSKCPIQNVYWYRLAIENSSFCDTWDLRSLWDRQSTCNIISWCVRVIFIPHLISSHPDYISLQENAFKTISFRRQQRNLRYLCPILSKFEILSRECRGSNIKFYVNSSSGSRADTCGGTEGHDKGKRQFSRLCESTLKWNSFA